MSAPEKSIRPLPHDHDAEAAVLGAILCDPNALDQVAHLLSEQSFNLPRHGIVWSACEAISSRGQAITLLTLRDELEARGTLQAVGGITFVASLTECPTSAHIEAHAEIVRRHAMSRHVIRTCEVVAARGYERGESPEELLALAQREILGVSTASERDQFVSLDEAMADAVQYMADLGSGAISAVRTGFHALDELTAGGLSDGQLVILAARPGVGKTAFALNLAANHALRDGGSVGFFSLEMGARDLATRLMVSVAGVDGKRLRQGLLSAKEEQKLSEARATLAGRKIHFDETMSPTAGQIAGRCRRLKREAGLTLVVVDYLQLIQSTRDTERREQQVAASTRALKALAMELKIPVVALSQLNRNIESRADKRPQLSDLRESGAIEQDADVVAFVDRDPTGETPEIASLIVSKQRNGPTGEVALHFDSASGSFRSAGAPERGFGSEPESRETRFGFREAEGPNVVRMDDFREPAPYRPEGDLPW